MYAIATHFGVAREHAEPEQRSTDAGIYLRKISAALFFNRKTLENMDTREFDEIWGILYASFT